jgi:drug/metabolite transporter (DMT)-like permease
MTTRPNSKLPSRLATWVTLAFIYVYLAWGATYMALHYAIASIPPFLMGGGRFTIAGTVLLALVALFQPKEFRLGSLREWRDSLIVGTSLLVGGNGGVAWAQQFVTTSEAALIFGSIPLWIILFDWLRPRGMRPSLRTAIGLAFGFVGLCILVKPSAGATETGMETWGKLALLFAACSWAAGAIYSRHVHAQGSPLLPMARQMTCGGLVLFLVALVHGDLARFDLPHVTLLSWLGFLYLVVPGSLLGFTAYVWLMRVSTPERASTIPYVNLVVAVLLGWTVGHEPMTARMVLGAGIIIGSVVLVLTKRSVQREVMTDEPPEA